MPKSVLDDALTDENRVANIAINEYGDVVGFFVLHQYYQHEGYDTHENVVYVRSLSINEKFQGNGYGTTMMMYLPQYVQDLFLISITCIWLSMLKIKVLGMCMNVLVLCTLLLKKKVPIGKERLYYLDLDSKHVSSLRLTENEASSISSYSVVDLLKDNQKVGFIALEKRIIELILLLLKCIKNNEKKVSLKVH